MKVGVNIHSGLGNQMFMIFATLSYYIDNCDNYVIYYDATKFKTDNFYWDSMFNKIKEKINNQCTITDTYKEPEFKYNKIPEFNKDIVLEGFFQSDKYFKHNINKIKC